MLGAVLRWVQQKILKQAGIRIRTLSFVLFGCDFRDKDKARKYEKIITWQLKLFERLDVTLKHEIQSR